MDNVSRAKTELIQASRALRDAGLMFRGYHANLSARISEDAMILTKGGNVAHLDEDSFAVVRIDGTVLEGEVAPAQAEIIPICMPRSIASVLRSAASSIPMRLTPQSLPSPINRFRLFTNPWSASE
ncbi:protein of unknown function [Kyrpidia spormannii]|uniref:Class II aldolase/adducin N-terminal domain-containing protein n=1 Tax=Kyrpidia spormannii TaxID=2055160 RepID=A0A6F9E234_9BACL|nr:protein of unknown function [Kyrpidia spormannii]